jgi:hypothetical protein
MSIIDKPSKKQLEKWMHDWIAHESPETPEEDERARKIIEFFEQYGITFDKFNPKNFSIFDSTAYPNYDQYAYIPGQHDVRKWLMAVKNMQYMQKSGMPYREAIRESTKGWKKMEIYDFLNWLKYYEEGTHMKYKFAQSYYVNDSMPGYFVPIRQDVSNADDVAPADFEADQQAAQEKEEKKQIIAQQRKKILSRLDSIRKMLRSEDGRTFAGDELETLLEAIHTLEKKISTLNKLSTSIRLYEDMIVREANVLYSKGFNKAADALYTAAQTPGASGQQLSKGPQAEQDAPPPSAPPPSAPPAIPSGEGQTGSSGAVNETPAGVGAPNPQSPSGGAETTPESKGQEIAVEDPQPIGIKQFIDAMNGQEGKTIEEEHATDDDLEVEDADDQLLVTEAQALPPRPPEAVMEDLPLTDDPAPARGKPAQLPRDPFIAKAPATKPAVPFTMDEEPLEVTEDDLETPKEKEADNVIPTTSNFDVKIDKVLASVTLEDIVSELEDLAKVFKVREIPRRLALVDVMLDSKGLASFFPQLSEAQNKSLESNNYISTRIEDILAKLRGALETKDIDLEGKEQEAAVDASGVKAKLQEDAAKEQQRKQQRKEQSEAELATPEKETPEIDMGELAGPVARPIG